MSERFISTLIPLARALNASQKDWMLIGGAAMHVYGLEHCDVNDIDVVISAETAIQLTQIYDWEVQRPIPSAKFCSDYLLTPDLGPTPIEVLGHFRIFYGGQWQFVQPKNTQTRSLCGVSISLPSPDHLAEIFRLCSREKDLKRIELIQNAF